MRIKPKILASNPPSIIMPTTGLDRMERPQMSFDNKAKNGISLSNLHLSRYFLASLSIPHCANDLAVLPKLPRLLPAKSQNFPQNIGPFGFPDDINICRRPHFPYNPATGKEKLLTAKTKNDYIRFSYKEII
jgi:hypothetical protein